MLELDSRLKAEAIEKAISIYETIREACTKPTKAISGEHLRVYEELSEWGVIDRFPIWKDENKPVYVTMIAMHLYRSMTAAKDTSSPVSKKTSSWDVIMNAIGGGKAKCGSKPSSSTETSPSKGSLSHTGS